jgi:hypothetical protein
LNPFSKRLGPPTFDCQLQPRDLYSPHIELTVLAANFNTTEFYHPNHQIGEPRKYLLDINPHHSIVTHDDLANKIDGRWIDTSTGKFIDITAVHEDLSEANTDASPQLFCKDGHPYQVSIPALREFHFQS